MIARRVPVITVLCAAAAVLAPAVRAESPVRAGSIAIERPWARATVLEGRPGVVYLTLRNSGAQDDALVAVATPVAKRAELHAHRKIGGVMRMLQVKSIPIPAGKAVALAPGGYHIMLMQRTVALKKGTRFPLTLTMKSGATATCR
jgi:copper(I)-binding protein